MAALNVYHLLLNEELEKIEKEGSVCNGTFFALHSLNGSVLEKAVEIVDRGSLMIFKAQGREILHITNSSGSSYILFKKINYCQCPFFANQVLTQQSKAPTCKHVLAANLALALKKYKVFEVDPKELSEMLRKNFAFESS